jgi:glycosyltransferase involved in cell wall biosynthesis
MRVSVVVITRDRGDEAARTAALLATLPERPAVIVVDNGSTDGTPDRVRSLAPSAAVLEAGRNLGGAARNAGVAHACTPYVAFSDDDSWWAPGSLTRATALLDDHPSVGLICARVLLGPEERFGPDLSHHGGEPPPPPRRHAGTLPGGLRGLRQRRAARGVLATRSGPHGCGDLPSRPWGPAAGWDGPPCGTRRSAAASPRQWPAPGGWLGRAG